MAIKRLMRQNRTIVLLPCFEIAGVLQVLGGTSASPIYAPLSAPTSAILNTWASITTYGGPGIGGNISGAVLDTVKLGLGASTTDNTLLITSVGNEVSATLTKVNASFGFMRDLNPTDTGVFNLAWQLTRVPDIRYVIADRIMGGKNSNAAFAASDVVDFYDVRTDNGIDVPADQKFTTFTQAFVPTGLVNPNYTLGS